MENFTEYDKKCMGIAFKWEYKFNTNMTNKDIADFRKECKDLQVNPLDVYEFMNDYSNC